MFDITAQYYDLIYLPIKDYPAEAAQLSPLLRRHNPACRSVLDVGCGTGEHARWLAADSFSVDGLDLNPEVVRLARQKHPAGEFFEADMRNFHLPRRYDAVVCLFSAIGYVRTIEGVESTLRCFREHLAQGGVVIVEPWFPPGILDTTRVFRNEGESDTVRISRECRVEVEGDMSRLRFDFEVVDETGSHHSTEVHELGLFTQEQMLGAFLRAGLVARHDAEWQTGRGLYIATSTAD